MTIEKHGMRRPNQGGLYEVTGRQRIFDPRQSTERDEEPVITQREGWDYSTLTAFLGTPRPVGDYTIHVIAEASVREWDLERAMIGVFTRSGLFQGNDMSYNALQAVLPEKLATRLRNEGFFTSSKPNRYKITEHALKGLFGVPSEEPLERMD